MVSGVVAARRRRYLMLNAPRSALEEIRALLPGMGAPSVIDLAEPGQIAVHAAVDADDIWNLLRAAQGCGRLVDPRPAGGAARRVRGASSRGRAAARRRDRGGRAGARRRGAARLDRAARRRAAGAAGAGGRLRARTAASRTSSRPCGRSPTRSPPSARRSGRRTSHSRRSTGVRAERRWLPLASVGVYVPGGPRGLSVLARDGRRAGAGRRVSSGSRS